MEFSSSHLKLGLPMMISGSPSCALAMNSCALRPPSSRGLSTTIENALGLVVHRVDALDAELFARLPSKWLLDGFDRRLRRDRWDASP